MPKLMPKLRRKLRRKRFSNGIITGYRTREWWIGIRENFPCDGWEINLLGLTLIIPSELLTMQTTTHKMVHPKREEL